MGAANGGGGTGGVPPNPNGGANNPQAMAQMQQMQMAYQQNMMMMQQQMQQMHMVANYGRQGSGGGAAANGMPPTMPNMVMTPPQAHRQPIMGANYMRQVPGVSGETTSFSFLGSDPRKQQQQDNKSFDFVQDAMKTEKK